MKPLRLIGYFVLVMALLGLASGRLLYNPIDSGEFHLLPIALGMLILSVAIIYLSGRRGSSPDRLAVYWSFIVVLAAIQISGGTSSLFYPALLLFLAWVSLPGVGGSAAELGLIAGVTGCAALLSGSLLEGSEPFFSRLVSLLPGSLKALLIPSIFGFAIEWLSNRFLSEVPREQRRGADSTSRIRRRRTAPEPGYEKELLSMLQRGSGAEAVCLFLRHDTDYLRLEHSVGDDAVIAKYMLPAEHRLVRMLGGLRKTVSARVDSPGERKELMPYRRRELDPDSPVWLMVCPLIRDETISGFLLQDFSGGQPPPGTATVMESASKIIGISPSQDSMARSSVRNEVNLMAGMMASCGQRSLDGVVTGIAGLLSQALPGSTISIADVDQPTGKISVWVSRGPLARHRTEKTCTDAGIAGWIVKYRAPCRRTGLNRGEQSIWTFSGGDDQQGSVSSCMGAPVMVGGAVVGLVMAEHEEDVFQREHEGMLFTAAGLLSMEMELCDLRERCGDLTEKDSLTGLPRVPLLHEHLKQMAARVQIYGGQVSVIVADIDGFTAINEKLGYSTGDKIIREAAIRFRGCFSPEIFVSRTGSDSFAACVPSAGRIELDALLTRIIETLSWDFSTGTRGPAVGISVSLGASYTRTNRKVLQLIGEAEQAAADAAEAAPGSIRMRRIGRGREPDPESVGE